MIEIQDMEKYYSIGDVKLHILKNINLTIRQGEFVAIMGRSGSGKSTLLHILGCLDIPTNGVYRLNNVEVSSLNDKELSKVRCSQLGFVFQSFNLLPQLNVMENVEVPLLYADVEQKERRKRCHEMLELVGLSDRIEHRPTQLSGGQMQRVAIARALVNNPVLVLADEPTGNLDTATSAEIMALFLDLNRRGRTIIMVTHDQQVAAYAHRVLHIVDGSFQGQAL